MNHKIAPSTIARTAALALALTNQVLSATGHAMLPIESAQLEQLVSTGLTVAAPLSAGGRTIPLPRKPSKPMTTSAS